MMKAKRIAAFVLILFTFPALLSALFFALPASGIEDPEIDGSASAILCHNESGTVIYRKETNVRLPAGPAVRLAAALVFEGIFKGDAGKTVTVHKKVTGLATSTLNPGLKSGEQITVYDLLCAMLIANSDDAVYALAYAAYPEEENPAGKLIEEMNKKAWALGMARTKFTDLIGKDADPVETGSYTCIDDLLTLALEVQRSTLLCEICGTTEHKISTAAAPNREVLLTRNYMMSAKRIPGYTYAPATGLAAQNGPIYGYSAIETAQFGSKHFTCVVIGSKAEKYGAFKDAKTLFEWGDKNFSYKRVLDDTAILGEIKVTLSGDSDYVTVAPKESVSAYLPNDLNPEEEISVRTELSFSELTAPVHEGLIAGKAIVMYNGRELAKVDLVTTGSLSQSNNRYYMALARNFIRSRAFLYICIGAAALFVVYVLISARVRYLRQNRPAALVFEEDAGGKAPPLLTTPESEQTEKPRDALKDGKKDESGQGVSEKKEEPSDAEGAAKESRGARQKDAKDAKAAKDGKAGSPEKPKESRGFFAGRGGKPERSGKAGKDEKTGNTEKTENTEKVEKTERPDGKKKSSPEKPKEGKPEKVRGADKSGKEQAPSEAPEEKAHGVQEGVFPDEAEDDLLVFGGVSTEKKESETPAKPRNDYVPEGWDIHVRRD